MADLMPAIFFGHGNPMIALLKNAYTDGWASIGNSVPRPKAVLWRLPERALPGAISRTRQSRTCPAC